MLISSREWKTLLFVGIYEKDLYIKFDYLLIMTRKWLTIWSYRYFVIILIYDEWIFYIISEYRNHRNQFCPTNFILFDIERKDNSMMDIIDLSSYSILYQNMLISEMTIIYYKWCINHWRFGVDTHFNQYLLISSRKKDTLISFIHFVVWDIIDMMNTEVINSWW